MSGLKKGDVDVEDMNQKYTKEQKGGGKNEREWRRPFFAFPGLIPIYIKIYFFCLIVNKLFFLFFCELIIHIFSVLL